MDDIIFSLNGVMTRKGKNRVRRYLGRGRGRAHGRGGQIMVDQNTVSHGLVPTESTCADNQLNISNVSESGLGTSSPLEKLGSQEVISNIMKGSNSMVRIVTRSMLSQESQKVGEVRDLSKEKTPINSRETAGNISRFTSPSYSKTLSQMAKSRSVPMDYAMHNLGFPTDIDSIEKLIDEEDRGDVKAISDTIDKMYATMVINQSTWGAYRAHSKMKFDELDQKMEKIDMKLAEYDRKHSEHLDRIKGMESSKASLHEIKLLKGEISELKDFVIKSNEKIIDRMTDFDCALDVQNRSTNEFRLEIQRLYKEHSLTNEKITAWDIRNNRLSFTIDGLPEEEENTSTCQAVINRFNSDTKANLSEQDFVSAYRIGKLAAPIEGQKVYPRPVRIEMKNDGMREKLLANRGKLKPNGDKSIVWVNDEHPDEYRRRKLMLHELVKYISKNTKHTASIEAGGLKLDGQIVMPSQFNDLPYDCDPERVQILSTIENGLAFAGQWAYLSNMYCCTFRYEGVNFSSSEQCFQYCKALHHKDLMKAKDIILTNDPFKCKKKGDAIEGNK